ncbi:SatD family protein [Kangiella sediminilitoris]|uniref:Uncharacterized protein n=1 Tax=Kangiella sediminilitoris TaxID=1144748 RepID=A0A1B3B9G7_9GAMM|nr:SatD family protein [Kangiella sediminilitoris]AOE49425.1 hypothetical protein KS2013_701 [Kangiella sediminilitoris]
MNRQAEKEVSPLKQVAVITGDIINSQTSEEGEGWLPALQDYLSKFGESPRDWQVFRGDSFQVIIEEPEKALLFAIGLKAVIKHFKKLDVRMAIGIGQVRTRADQALQSNGEAFVNSGRMFDSLKKQTLAVKTPWQDFDKAINLFLKLALLTMDDWSETSAEVVAASLEKPGATQKEIADLLSIPQSRVSERLSRAGYDAITDTERYYRESVTKRLQQGE